MCCLRAGKREGIMVNKNASDLVYMFSYTHSLSKINHLHKCDLMEAILYKNVILLNTSNVTQNPKLIKYIICNNSTILTI